MSSHNPEILYITEPIVAKNRNDCTDSYWEFWKVWIGTKYPGRVLVIVRYVAILPLVLRPLTVFLQNPPLPVTKFLPHSWNSISPVCDGESHDSSFSCLKCAIGIKTFLPICTIVLFLVELN